MRPDLLPALTAIDDQAEDPFAAGWDAACAAARATAQAPRDPDARLEAALRALVDAARPVLDWFTTGVHLDAADAAELQLAYTAAIAALKE